MIYLVDGAFDENRKKWCKENNIPHISGLIASFPIFCFALGFLSEKRIDKMMSTLILFNKEDVIAYKLRWL